jgi:hypothetical protein
VILTLEPNVKGAVISGEGVILISRAGVQFNPGRVSPGVTSVNILVDGKPSNLTITLLDLPTASFAFVIDPLGNLTLTNNSINAATYTWQIDKEIISTDKKDPIIKLVSSFNAPSIFVALTAEGKCGSVTDGPRIIEFRKEPQVNPCLDNADLFVKDSIETTTNLRETSDINKFNKETVNFISDTESRFLDVQKDLESYILGKSNAKLSEIFKQEYFNSIATVVAAAIRLQNLNQIAAVEKLIELNTSLYYTILRCQDPETLKAAEKQIFPTGVLFNNLFKSFNEIKFNTDKDGSLKDFLASMLKVFPKVDFILTNLNLQINELTTGAKFK